MDDTRETPPAERVVPVQEFKVKPFRSREEMQAAMDRDFPLDPWVDNPERHEKIRLARTTHEYEMTLTCKGFPSADSLATLERAALELARGQDAEAVKPIHRALPAFIGEHHVAIERVEMDGKPWAGPGWHHWTVDVVVWRDTEAVLADDGR